jgi:hypothetical protein
MTNISKMDQEIQREEQKLHASDDDLQEEEQSKSPLESAPSQDTAVAKQRSRKNRFLSSIFCFERVEMAERTNLRKVLKP